VQTLLCPNRRGRKKSLPPPTEEDRRQYHRARLRNYRLSASRLPTAERIMLQVLIEQTGRDADKPVQEGSPGILTIFSSKPKISAK
jgi:hypothetical protein